MNDKLSRCKRLNLGCGADIRKDFINLDSKSLDGVDLVHDLDELPLPFPDNRFDEIVCRDVLEHVDYCRLLGEIFRVSTLGCVIRVRVPHFTSANNFVDPTHKHLFSVRTFGFFVKGGQRDYYFNFHFSRILRQRIKFSKTNQFLWNHLVEPAVNSKRFNEDAGFL